MMKARVHFKGDLFILFLGLFVPVYSVFFVFGFKPLYAFSSTLHMFTFVYEKASTNKPALTYCSDLMMQDCTLGSVVASG